MNNSAEPSIQDNPHVSTRNDCLKYQIDFLKIEIKYIEESIARMDQITQTTKNWAVITWAGGVALALGQKDLRIYIGFTAIIPLSFWFIDATWRRLQSRAIYRLNKISDFLNDERLIESIKIGKLSRFIVLDPMGTQYKKEENYKKFTKLSRKLKYPEIRIFYVMFIIISLLLQLFFLLIN